MEELRNSRSYIDAYAKYIKTGKDKEIRALLTANATVLEGTTQIPVPEFVYDTVKTAWEDSELLRYVRKLYVKGNLKVGFEVSSSGAEVHPEGGDPIQEEELQIGVVELVPEMVKKYVMLSDELEAMASRDFLMYVYDELTHQIALKLETEIINAITNQPVGVTVPEVVNYGTNPKPETIAMSLSKLCAEAKNPVAIMNRGTWGEFKKAQYEANYPIDVFEKLTVIFSDALKSYADASVNEPYLIVGDFENGFLMNYPEGDEIRIKRDDITLATQDLVRYVGRVYCAMGVIAPRHFVAVTKASDEGGEGGGGSGDGIVFGHKPVKFNIQNRAASVDMVITQSGLLFVVDGQLYIEEGISISETGEGLDIAPPRDTEFEAFSLVTPFGGSPVYEFILEVEQNGETTRAYTITGTNCTVTAVTGSPNRYIVQIAENETNVAYVNVNIEGGIS